MAGGKRADRAVAWATALSAVAFYVGNRWGMLACREDDALMGLTRALSADLATEILLDPLKVSFGGVPLLCGLSLFVATWYAFAYYANARREVRRHDEYGTARRGTVAEGREYRDARDPSNNIVLTRRLSLAIHPTESVRRTLPARNICVIGPTGTGKTVGYVMPNILQMCLGLERDMVVVDPKGTTLACCGHALAAAGVDVSVFNTVDLAMSDRYNPLAAIETPEDVIAFVDCLMANTNDGKKSAEGIWDGGERLLYRTVITLLLDWYPREDLTFQNMVRLVDLIDIADDSSAARCPLDYIFAEIETGEAWARDEQSPTDPESAFVPVRDDAHGGLVRVPSLMVRRDGVCPALATRADGGHGLDAADDPATTLWHEFRSGSSKTLRSFLVSAHARLAYLTTPAVLDLLAARDGRDELHLERLGQVRDEWGRTLRPRVLFVVSSDTEGSLQPLLAMACWQAIRVPLRIADTRCGGRLPRPVSIVLDEFANIGKISDFTRVLTVVRSRDMDVQILLQSHSQLRELFGPEGASTVREGCATTVFLGGANATYTAEVLSKEYGKTTAYKEDSSRQRGAHGGSSTVSTSSYERDVYDASEVVHLDAGHALVTLGAGYAIDDLKYDIARHPAYDPTYMARDPERRFDYLAWKRAGKPMGEHLVAWEEAWFGTELPAREAAEAADARLALARRRLAEAERDHARTPGDTGATRAVELARMAVELRELEARARSRRLARSHADACLAAGMAAPDASPSEAETAEAEAAANGYLLTLGETLSASELAFVLGDDSGGEAHAHAKAAIARPCDGRDGRASGDGHPNTARVQK